MSNSEADTPYIRPNFQNVPFWNPTKILDHEIGKHIHRMDLNECPYPPSPEVIAAMHSVAHTLNRYPDGTCPELTPLVAERLGVPQETITWGGGSTQLLTSIAEISVAPGQNLVAPNLVWKRFQGVYKIVDANVTAVPNRADGSIDVEALTNAIGNDTRLLICVTPNNPTGMMLSEDEIRHVSENTPENVLLFMDEAYHEFAIHAGGPNALEILKDRKGPWAVTRTFSKAYALAGVRLGYAICSSPEIVDAIRMVSSTFNLNGMAEAAAMAAWNQPEYTQFILDKNAEERARVEAGLRDMGYEPMQSVTNFVSCDIGRPGMEVVAAMRERGVRISTVGGDEFANYIRLSMGIPEDTDAFLKELREVLK
ncbi:MAG: aminotransferase class I/II-fold pyridoxal phosphate-dependent enzyme [Rhodospirillaceae bacterium]|nr:aminotransferase class I/II-fold pyridoxal phosphate-dependent enzyme [Rhodospirillaceae bacterium]MBT4590293.1 aminotransferase class I/II-fold pyridoxal phosphate-dependent enzyme [Rhodospirillaceae bacterium]MBT7265919.1 aminotransferase class I/II-fold pyridoxal phosphate-dependent enzyme [Rhodospirillaceae bacterium]